MIVFIIRLNMIATIILQVIECLFTIALVLFFSSSKYFYLISYIMILNNNFLDHYIQYNLHNIIPMDARFFFGFPHFK